MKAQISPSFRRGSGWLLAVLLVLGWPAAAQENDDCLMCHADPDLTGERNGREISLHVDEDGYAGSKHGDLDCIFCHQDLDGAELPHEEELERVDCSMCHDEPPGDLAKSVHGGAAVDCANCHGTHEIRSASQIRCGSCHATQTRQHANSLHGRATARGDELAPGCVTCHGGHTIRPHTDPNSPTAIMNIPALCGQCHHEGSPVSQTHDIPQDRILRNYSQSIHGEGLFERGLTVTAVCTSCHTSHNILPHTDADSSIHADNVATTCTQCHGQIETVHRKVIEGRLWEEEPHKIPVCVECHSPHRIRRVQYPAAAASEDCLACHNDPGLTTERSGATVSLFVDGAEYAAGAHNGTACAQCHTEVTPSADRACETIRSPVDCSICHAETVLDYQSSIHGVLAADGDADAPTCIDCHDKHATEPKILPSSPTFPRNVPDLCGRCHRAGMKAATRIESELSDIVESYVDSIHGKGLVKSGLLVTATCTSCHGHHRELPASDPASSVNSANVADTCGTCHHGIEETFRTSIHWPGNTETDRELPTCEDCHTSHTISRTDLGNFRFRMMDQCGRCHVSEAETFFDTFHGKVSRLGSAGAAKCYDCHGTHDILPPSNPDSALSRDNVVETCASCHPGSHRRFAGYLTHATHHDPEKYPWLFWAFWGMTALLIGTLTFALMHTLAWLVRLWLSRDEWKAHKEQAKSNCKPLYRRFNQLQRMLHLFMLLSFLTLAITGMTLKFSYMGWAQTVSWLLGGFDTMGTLHRTGAVVLFTVFLLHLWDILQIKRTTGRSWKEMVTGPDTISFTPRDLKEFVQSIKWFFGIGERPHYGRYTYWEKFDYAAVFWGVFIIGSTGLILWFPETFTYVLPGWAVNVATIIHSDEALLAVAFIFTVHFFNTHFRPDKFPMDPVIFTGRVTLEELKYDKPSEYEEMKASGELDKKLVQPITKSVETAFRIFGFVALAVGLTLIALIVYALLFGYR